MPVLINFKICDNADVCSSVEVCPTEAIYWDIEKQTLKIDNTKCTSCGECVEVCPAGAILVAQNENEYKQFKQDIDSDPRTLKDLMVERYGASPISDSTLASIDFVSELISKKSDVIAIEIIDEPSTECLIDSVPISEIFPNPGYRHYKVDISDSTYSGFAQKYDIDNIPSMLVFKEGVLKIKVDGVIQNRNIPQRNEMINAVRAAIN